MSFLCLFPKGGASQGVGQISVDSVKLAGLLCPYQGGVAHVAFAGGHLYLSSLSALSAPGHYLIPADSNKNPQSAWAELRLDDSGLHIQTDPMGMFPLWIYEDDQRLIVTSEVKSLLACTAKITPVLKSHDELLAFKKRPANLALMTTSSVCSPVRVCKCPPR